MASVKDLVFNKGGIGTSISREETIERVNPLIRRLVVLNHLHDYAIQHLADRDAAARLEELQWVARADVGKLAETIYSAGGTAYTGAELDPAQFRLDEGDDRMADRLIEEEQAFADTLTSELKEVNHQIRTTAILTLVRTNGLNRLAYLKGIAPRGPRR